MARQAGHDNRIDIAYVIAGNYKLGATFSQLLDLLIKVGVEGVYGRLEQFCQNRMTTPCGAGVLAFLFVVVIDVSTILHSCFTIAQAVSVDKKYT